MLFRRLTTFLRAESLILGGLVLLVMAVVTVNFLMRRLRTRSTDTDGLGCTDEHEP